MLSIESIGQRRDFKILAIQNNYLLARVTSRAGYVSISPELEKELRTWLQFRAIGDAYHLSAQPAENDLLFPSEAGTPFRIGNYLKRVLKPIGKTAGVHGVTFQAMRRTFATHFQRYGSPKDAQTQLRHSKLEMTGWYMKQIPESVRAAVERMDAEISKPMEDHAVNEGGQIQ